MRCSIRTFFMSAFVMMLAVPHGAEAYMGPGAGISAIGTVLALIGAILLAIIGFVWYPIKRLLSRIKKKHDSGIPS